MSSIAAVLITAATAAGLLWVITTPRPRRGDRRRVQPGTKSRKPDFWISAVVVPALVVMVVFGDSHLRTLALVSLVWGVLVVVVTRMRTRSGRR